MQPGPSLLALLWVVSDVSHAIPIFNLLGGGGGGGSQRPKCRYVPQTAYFPTYDTVYKQQCSTSYENECTTEVRQHSPSLLQLMAVFCFSMRPSIRQLMNRNVQRSTRLRNGLSLTLPGITSCARFVLR